MPGSDVKRNFRVRVASIYPAAARLCVHDIASVDTVRGIQEHSRVMLDALIGLTGIRRFRFRLQSFDPHAVYKSREGVKHARLLFSVLSELACSQKLETTGFSKTQAGRGG